MSFKLNKTLKSRYFNQIFTCVALIVLGLGSITSLSASAQATTGRGLVITPAQIEQEADKNIPYDLNITLENDSEEDGINLKPILYQFNSLTEDGKPDVKPVDPNSPQANWISFADTAITLNKGEKKDAKVRVLVPDSAQSGSYYFALTFARDYQGQNQAGQVVNISSQLASLLFLTVKGQVNRDVQLNEIRVSNTTIDPFFDPLSINYKVNLNGNAYIRPAGNIFTGNDQTNPENTLTINPNQVIVLPNSSRTFETRINPILDWLYKDKDNQTSTGDLTIVNNYNRPWFGNQKINLKMIYVNNEGKLDQKSAELNVWFVPWRFILVLVGVLALGLIGFFALKKSKKTDKKAKSLS